MIERKIPNLFSGCFDCLLYGWPVPGTWFVFFFLSFDWSRLQHIVACFNLPGTSTVPGIVPGTNSEKNVPIINEKREDSMEENLRI